MSKVISLKDVGSLVNDGDTILVGGFYTIGTPENIIMEVLKQDKKDLTVVNNDGGNPNSALGKLIYSGNVKKVILTWAGYLTDLPRMVDDKEIELELNPQGTLIERIRAGGYGLGGVLTKTGLGTYIEDNKIGERININNEDYLYHTPIKGNITFVEAYEADEAGNLIFRRTQRNFGDTMAFASDIVVASVVKPIRELGELDPDKIMVPGPMVDYIIRRGDGNE